MCEQLNCVTCRYWNTGSKSCIPLGCVEYEYYKCEHCVHRIPEGEIVMCNLKKKPVSEIYDCELFEAFVYSKKV